MKITNVGKDNTYAITRGWVGPLAAAGTGLISVGDGVDSSGPATNLQFSGLTVTDLGDGNFLVSTSWKIPVRVATTMAGSLATAYEDGDVVDGITLAAGDRVLIKDQTDATENGIYLVGFSGAPDRTPDMDDGSEVLGGVVYVIDGTVNATRIFVATNTTEPTLGTDDVTFAPIDAVIPAGTYELATEGGQSVIKAHGSMGATETFDPTDGNVHTGTLDANLTITLGSPSGSGACLLEIRALQDGTGGRTIIWPGSVTWKGGIAPNPTTTAGTTWVYTVESTDGGVNWIGDWGGSQTLTGIDFLVGTATGALSAEIVVGTTPGGELGGTWGSPTVDTTHSGSSHAAAIATAEAYTDAALVNVAGLHAHVVGETHLSDGATGTYTLDEAFEPGSVEAFNTTTLAYLVVTETAPDQATVSAVGAAGDKITFSYAGSLA